MAEVKESWARVTAWLAANAPASCATLSPPATAAELDACERVLTIALQAELRRLLLVSNGAAEFDTDGTYHWEAAFLPGGYRLLSAADLARESRNLVDIARELGDHMIGTWWHPEWVLFGRNTGAGWHGHRPAPRPRAGRGRPVRFRRHH